jgi:hypothetical protein
MQARTFLLSHQSLTKLNERNFEIAHPQLRDAYRPND